MDNFIRKRIDIATCWATNRISAMDTLERYEDSYAIAEEFREWILHIGEKNENLRDSVLNFPKELKKLIRRYPTFADARAALTALNWSKGESGNAESNWIAVTELDPRYSDEEWLKKIRRWPPQPIKDLMNFIDLK